MLKLDTSSVFYKQLPCNGMCTRKLFLHSYNQYANLKRNHSNQHSNLTHTRLFHLEFIQMSKKNVKLIKLPQFNTAKYLVDNSLSHPGKLLPHNRFVNQFGRVVLLPSLGGCKNNCLLLAFRLNGHCLVVCQAYNTIRAPSLTRNRHTNSLTLYIQSIKNFNCT